MPQLDELAQTLNSQLHDLNVTSRVLAHHDPGVLKLELELTPDAAEALSRALAHAHGELTPAEERWEAVSAAASEIEGFTGGEAAE